MSDIKTIPHNFGVEAAVLGALIFDNRLLDTVSGKLSELSFYGEQHILIWTALTALRASGKIADGVTLIEFFNREDQLKKIGGEEYLSEIVSKCALQEELQEFAQILTGLQGRRSLIKTAQSVEARALKPQINETAASIASDAQKVMSEIIVGSAAVKPPTHAVLGIKGLVQKAKEQKDSGANTGEAFLSTGMDFLDNRLGGGLFAPDLVILAGRPSMGKCLDYHTLVIMHDGSQKKAGEVKVGDILMGDDSTPRKILSTTTGQEEMIWVRQTNGDDYKVNASHILSLKKAKSEGVEPKGFVKDMPIRDVMAMSDRALKIWKGYKAPYEGVDKKLPLDPYVLGLWLGDGTTTDSTITNSDIEIHTALRAYAEKTGAEFSVKVYGDKTPSIRIKGTKSAQPLKRTLSGINVIGNKHIPEIYFTASTAQRAALLAGLIDTDGHKEKFGRGTYGVIQKSKKLATGIKRLADSLGLRTKITIRTMKCQTGAVGDYFRLRISGDLTHVPMRVERKKAEAWQCVKDWRLSKLSFESDGMGTYYGFEIDGNRRFMLADGTITHNTTLANQIALNVSRTPSLKMPDKTASVLFYSLEMTDEQLSAKIMTMNAFGEFGRRFDSGKIRNGQMPIDDMDLMGSFADQRVGDIHIDDRSGLTLQDIQTEAHSHIRTKGYLDLIIIDYLQIAKFIAAGSWANKAEMIGDFTTGLKNLSKALNVPTIALSQLSRQVEQRDDKRPQLSDLRESGSIEQDADVVMFVYREEYYLKRSEPTGGGVKYAEWKADMAALEKVITVIVGKQRHGPIGSDDGYIDLMTGYVGDCNPNDMLGTAAWNDDRWESDLTSENPETHPNPLR